MRLRRLDLTRYGRFSDAVLDFGSRGAGPDLHVIYGPNEAGKSTALSAWLDLLYGIHPQTPYAFLHDYKAMRVGGVIEGADGRTDTFARIKGNANTLRDAHDQPVGETALAPWLGGIDRDAYKAMFSLDDDTLEQGGESILDSRGDLGELLFSASAGLSDLTERLHALEGRADRFHRPRARKTELADLKHALEQLTRERKALDLRAGDYRQRIQAREAAEADHEAAVQALAQARTRRQEVERLRQGFTCLREVNRIRDDLDAFEGLPDAPPGWVEEVTGLQRDEVRLVTEREGLDGRIDHLEQDLAAICVDDAVLSVAERLDRLREDLESRYRTADLDLPRVRDEARDLEARIADRLRRLDQPPDTEPGGLILPAATVRTLRDLIARRSGEVGRLEAAQAEQRAADERLATAQAALERITGPAQGDDPEDASAWHALDAAVRVSARDDAETRLRMEMRGRVAAADALSDALMALAPWSGDASALAALAVPDAARLAAWRTALTEAETAVKDATREVHRLESERARLTARAEVRRAAGGVMDDEAAAALRAGRDEAWRRHRAALDAATADAFLDTMRADDAATESRLAQSADLARLRQAAVEAAALDSDLQQARAHCQAALEARDRQAKRVADAVSSVGLPSDWPVESLADWLDRRRAALDAHDALRAADRRIAAAREDADRIRETLCAALVGVGVSAMPDADVATLREAAEVALKARAERATRLDAARAGLEDARRAVDDRSRALKEAGEAEARWRNDWRVALADTWLDGAGLAAAPEAVGGVLDDLVMLEGWLAERAGLARRIEGMARDQARYTEALTVLMTDLGEPAPPGQPLRAAEALAGRLNAAREADALRARARKELTQAHEARAALEPPMAALAGRREEMATLFGVETLADVAGALKRVEVRGRLRERLAEAQAALTEAVRATGPAEAEAMLAERDPAALDQQAADLDARLEDLEDTRLTCRDAVTRARDALAGLDGDDAVARLEARRRTLLLEIDERARAALRLRLGVVAARRALTLYRERHRSAMLARAEAAFVTISRGAYAGLAVQPGDGTETLVVRAADGGAKPVEALSKGTRFQLYLALRVAGYHEVADRGATVPFIADDIMETFDDFRAEEALRLFADMATVGQVIYMTHHRHLVTMARKVCPDVTIHDLTDAGPSAGG